MLFNDFDNLFTKDVRKTFENGSNDVMVRAYLNKFSTVVDTTEYSEKFNSTEGMDLPTYVEEKQLLPLNQLEKGFVTILTSRTPAHRICISKDVRLQAGDNTTSLRTHLSREIQLAITRFLKFNEIEAHRVFNQGFTNLPVNNGRTGTATVAAPDGQATFDVAHTWNSTANTWDNVLAAVALDLNVVREVERRAAAFVDATGCEMPMFPNKIIVKAGSTAAQQAKKIFDVTVNNNQYRVDTPDDLNIYAGRYSIIETPYIESDTAYFFVADADNAMNMGIENPWTFRFQQRPMLEGTLMQTANLAFEYAYSEAIKFGLYNQPFNMRGSQGA